MGPSVDTHGGRTRKDLGRTNPSPLLENASNTPLSFRLAKQDDPQYSSPKASESCSDSSYGIQSLQNTIHETTTIENDLEQDSDDHTDGRRRSTLRPKAQNRSRDPSRGSIEPASTTSTESLPFVPHHRNPSIPSMSHSLASLSLYSQAPLSSLPSSPKSTSNPSFRQSDEESIDERASQAIASSEDEEAEPPRSETADSAPHLIMPSIKMPSRRPFTERGKAMGRLKVLIAGNSGAGKTTLIKSIVQTCEDIVHVDPISPSSPLVKQSPGHKTKDKHESSSIKTTRSITEIHASTKPYPSWWSDIEDTKILRRRKSVGDTVLERNLCFVDTPGYSNGISKIESIQTVLQYIQLQLTKPFSAPTASEGDITGLLSGSGGSQVDVVLYLVAEELKEEDMAYLQRLTSVTNVIPLISKSDSLSLEEAEMLKRSIDRLRDSEINLFSFDSDHSSTRSAYRVCSAPSDDSDTMDASVLMSSDYIQPLMPSELTLLIQQMFDPDNVAFLRHLAAKKLVQAQGSSIFSVTGNPQSNLPNSPLTRPSLSPRSTTTQAIVPYNSSPYTQAKIADHTFQEEKLAQIRLAKWAGELQRSLQNERARYEAIARGERAVWLTQKLGECQSEGALIPSWSSNMPTEGECESTKTDRAPVSGHRGLLDASDPLGLMRWQRRGWIAFQVVGTFGALGAIAVWMARTRGGSEGYLTSTWEWLGGRA